jgi:hypothetical protein
MPTWLRLEAPRSALLHAALSLALGCTPRAKSVEVGVDIVGAAARPDHLVIVLEENHAFAEIVGSADASYLGILANGGALFTNSFAVEHPSQPNYLDLFSGSNQGVTDDSCPHTFASPNLASELVAAGLSFATYAEGLPSVGASDCQAGAYWRKHNPASNFTNVAPQTQQPFSAFPSD